METILGDLSAKWSERAGQASRFPQLADALNLISEGGILVRDTCLEIKFPQPASNSDTEIILVGAVIATNPHVTSLNLVCSSVSIPAFEIFLESLVSSNITNLHLCCKDIKFVQVFRLLGRLSLNPRHLSVTLENVLFDFESAPLFGFIVARPNSGITELKIIKSDIPDSRAIRRFLDFNHSSLKSLSFVNRAAGITQMMLEAIFIALGKTQIRKLELGRIQVNPILFIEFLNKMPYLLTELTIHFAQGTSISNPQVPSTWFPIKSYTIHRITYCWTGVDGKIYEQLTLTNQYTSSPGFRVLLLILAPKNRSRPIKRLENTEVFRMLDMAYDVGRLRSNIISIQHLSL